MKFITQATLKSIPALFFALLFAVLIATPTAHATETWYSGGETCTTCAGATGSWYDIATPVTTGSWYDIATPENTGSWYDIASPIETGSWYDIAVPADTGSWFDIATPVSTGSWYDIATPVTTGSWYDIATPVSTLSSFETDYRTAVGGGNRTIPHVQIAQRPQTSNFELDYYNATRSTRPSTTPAISTGGGTTVINNTNTNTVNVPQQQPVVYNYQPQQPVYNYQPPVQYVQPTVTVAQTGYTPAYTYVPVNNVPYTGTNDVAYVLTLIAVVLATVAGFVYFRKDAVAAFAGMNASHVTLSEVINETLHNSEAVVGQGNTDEVEEGIEDTTEPTLSLINGENGPELSFSRA